jgi:restriction system protein
MTEIPKFNEMYQAILTTVGDEKDYSLPQLRDSVAVIKNVSDDSRNIMLDSGVRSVFDDRVGWARTYLKAAGLITYPKRGITRITDLGKQILENHLSELDNEYLKKFDSFRDFLLRKRDENSSVPKEKEDELASDDITPLERMQKAFSEINSSIGYELLSEIMSRPPDYFEKIVIKLLVKMGYGGVLGEEAGKVTRSKSDEGIDGVVRQDKLGFSNIYIQAKRWNQDKTVNRPDIQAFVGAIANKKGNGLFITTASFSDGAKQCAKENHVVLIDGKELTSLMIDHGLGVSTSEIYEIKKIDSDFFEE